MGVILVHLAPCEEILLRNFKERHYIIIGFIGPSVAKWAVVAKLLLKKCNLEKLN
jgi:hypothetical protein